MQKSLLFSITLVFATIHLSTQNLGKKALAPDLGFLDFRFISAVKSSGGLSLELSKCDCGGRPVEAAISVVYTDLPKHKMFLCICKNPSTSARFIVNAMGQVPAPIRRYVLGMISMPKGTGSGAYSNGDVIRFFESNNVVSLYIHESAHSFDRGKSASAEWHKAIAQDSCVADNYANTNYAESFAQAVVVWTSLVGTKRDKDLGGNQFACMKNQLKLMTKYLPANSLLPKRKRDYESSSEDTEDVREISDGEFFV